MRDRGRAGEQEALKEDVVICDAIVDSCGCIPTKPRKVGEEDMQGRTVLRYQSCMQNKKRTQIYEHVDNKNKKKELVANYQHEQ